MTCPALVVGSLIGVVLKRGLPEKWQQTMMSGIALCIVVIGLQMAMKTNNIIITICSLVIGAIIGESVDIELRMQRLGDWVGGKVAKGDASVAARIADNCYFDRGGYRYHGRVKALCEAIRAGGVRI